MNYLILFLLFFSCTSTQDCPEKINLLPMYGGLKKCPDQISADNEFLQLCDKTFKNRKLACEYHVNKGWDYFYANIQDTSMMRFNQAWLLDSTNADVYWGFGNLLGMQKKFKESIFYFDKSIKLNPNNAKIWECASTSYGQLFFETKKLELLNTSIEYLKKSMKLDSLNARVYGQLAASYLYISQNDSAIKYLKLADKFDSTQVNPEVRKILTGK